jgi:hypothetical protein
MLAITPAKMKIAPAQVSSHPGMLRPFQNNSPTPNQQGYERDTEGASAIETPIGADHGYPVGQKICAGARHDEAHHKVAESTWGSTHVAETTIFHEPRITEVQAGGRRTDLPASGPSVVHFLGFLQ